MVTPRYVRRRRTRTWCGRRSNSLRPRFHSRRWHLGLRGWTTLPAQGSEKDTRRCWYCPGKKNESIVINNDITVTIVEIRGDKVRLGIVAPKEVPVHRQEVYDAIHGQNGTTAPTPVVVNKNAEAPPSTL